MIPYNINLAVPFHQIKGNQIAKFARPSRSFLQSMMFSSVMIIQIVSFCIAVGIRFGREDE